MPNLVDRYADLNGLRLHYVAAGEGNARLIVFLHGFPEFWYAWRAQLAEFGRDFHAVAPDLPGYNLSDKPTDVRAYGTRKVAEVIGALVAHLGHQQCILVGHDWGGGVAWGAGLFTPEWISHLVIINCPHPAIFARELNENPAQQQASAYMLFFRRPVAEEYLAADNYRRLRRSFGDIFSAPDDEAAYLAAWSQPGALTGGLNYYRMMRLPDAFGGPDKLPVPTTPAERLPYMLSMPTLVIWGEQDTALLVGNLDGLEDYVPNLTLQRIPDGTHWVVHEHPDLVNRHIRNFITH